MQSSAGVRCSGCGELPGPHDARPWSYCPYCGKRLAGGETAAEEDGEEIILATVVEPGERFAEQIVIDPHRRAARRPAPAFSDAVDSRNHELWIRGLGRGPAFFLVFCGILGMPAPLINVFTFLAVVSPDPGQPAGYSYPLTLVLFLLTFGAYYFTFYGAAALWRMRSPGVARFSAVLLVLASLTSLIVMTLGVLSVYNDLRIPPRVQASRWFELFIVLQAIHLLLATYACIQTFALLGAPEVRACLREQE